MKRRSAASTIPVAILLLVGGCASPPVEADEARGSIRGRVLAGPVCPVIREPPVQECADRPVEGARLVVVDRQGREVASAVSDADGRFSVELAAGEYSVIPQAVPGLLGTAAPVDVTVATGEQLDLDVLYDTGIR